MFETEKSPILRRSDLLTRTIDDELVILDRATGYVHRLNHAAARIWAYCDGRYSVQDIAASLTGTYDVSHEIALSDAAATVADFRKLGLLTDSWIPDSPGKGKR
jgi:hypothetical protein